MRSSTEWRVELLRTADRGRDEVADGSWHWRAVRDMDAVWEKNSGTWARLGSDANKNDDRAPRGRRFSK
jgi:hypothetical protein